VPQTHKYRRANHLERKEVSKLRIFFRKLMRLHVPECLYECERTFKESYEFCGEKDDKGFFGCTRKIGHKGNHVACGTVDHDLKVWEAK